MNTKANTNPYDEIRSLLPKLPHKMQVSFALYCAKDVYPLVREEDRTVVKDCLDIVELWLKGKATAKECKAVADTTYNIAYTVYTARAVINAANAANVVYAANAAANAAAYAAYYSAYAYAAAHSASNAVSTANYDKAMEKYLKHLNEMIKDLTSIEKILFNMAGYNA